MRYGALFGWGVVIYAVMSLVWDGFITYGFVEGLAPRIVGLVILFGLALLAGVSLRLRSSLDILPYSFAWVVMMALFDAVFSVPYTGWQLYFDFNLWIGYAFVLIIPLFAPYFHFERFAEVPRGA